MKNLPTFIALAFLIAGGCVGEDKQVVLSIVLIGIGIAILLISGVVTWKKDNEACQQDIEDEKRKGIL